MADEADMANNAIEMALNAKLKSVTTKVAENDTGKCVWCGEAVSDKRRWCSAECRDEQERFG